MIADKVKPKIAKAISKFPTRLNIFRGSLNEFGEPTNDVLVCSLDGLYYQGNTAMSIILEDKGQVTSNKQEFLIVLFDEESQKIKIGDTVTIKDTKYTIKDITNQNNLDIYFNILIGE